MGYELHIIRADHWTDAAATPIGASEWATLAAGLTACGSVGPTPVFTLDVADPDAPSLYLDQGEVIVTGATPRHLPELVAIAASLGARLQGDDGEEYSPDGYPV